MINLIIKILRYLQLFFTKRLKNKTVSASETCAVNDKVEELVSQFTHSIGQKFVFSGKNTEQKLSVALLVAKKLNKEYLKIDLKSNASKYLGETEKNLDKILSRAEELDLVLIIDEGDALLGARTTIPDASDRYENLETNYILKLIENYMGIVILFTNQIEVSNKKYSECFKTNVHFSILEPKK